jgi:hypothetical protein
MSTIAEALYHIFGRRLMRTRHDHSKLFVLFLVHQLQHACEPSDRHLLDANEDTHQFLDEDHTEEWMELEVVLHLVW